MADKRRTKKDNLGPTYVDEQIATLETTPIAIPQNTNGVSKMPLKVNFNNIGSVLPPSIYEAQLDSFKVGQAKSSGADMITLIFAVKNDEQYENRKIYRNFMVEGNAGYYLMDALVSLGADAEELAGDPDRADDPTYEGVDVEDIIKRCIGSKVRLHLGIRSYEQNGVTKESNDVTKIEPI